MYKPSTDFVNILRSVFLCPSLDPYSCRCRTVVAFILTCTQSKESTVLFGTSEKYYSYLMNMHSIYSSRSCVGCHGTLGSAKSLQLHKVASLHCWWCSMLKARKFTCPHLSSGSILVDFGWPKELVCTVVATVVFLPGRQRVSIFTFSQQCKWNAHPHGPPSRPWLQPHRPTSAIHQSANLASSF